MTHSVNTGERIEGLLYAKTRTTAVTEMAAFDSFPPSVRAAIRDHIMPICCTELEPQVHAFPPDVIVDALKIHERKVRAAIT